MLRTSARIFLVAIVIAATSVAAIRGFRNPSDAREWHPHQRLMPQVRFDGHLVEIRNIRDFVHRGEDDFEARYIDRTFDLRDLESADYVVSRFGGVPGLAHAFLSFDFGDEHLAVSVEARKERGETYSPLRGLLNSYELMYVVGTERDLIGIRTHVWKEDVTLYPVRAPRENVRSVFVDMLRRADSLSKHPEFYDTLMNSCNSNIVAHVNAITPGRIGLDFRTVLPGFADELAFEQGLIDSSLPLERVRELYRIDEAARAVPLDGDFSKNIRRTLPPRS